MRITKAKIAVSTALTMIILAVITTNTLAHNSPIPYVRIYIWDGVSTNVFPLVAYPGNFYVYAYIDAPASWYNTASGIVGVTASFRVDPNQLELLTSTAMPDMDFEGWPDSFLGDFIEDNFYTQSTFFTGGTIDKSTGTISATADIILGFSTLGVGAGAGPKPLWRWRMRTWSGVTPSYSALNIFDAYYTTVDGVKHPIDIVDNGHYGTPPQQYTMSYMGSLLPPGDPTSTDWHELYPVYSNEWHLTSWVDNGDGDLSASDQIDMTQMVGPEVGWIYWYHVDVVTTTIHWTFKTGPAYPDDLTTEEGAAESPVYTTEPDWLHNPIGSTWHQVYPDYSREFVITSWEDNGGVAGVFDPSDQFDFEYIDDPGVTVWAHLDDVTTDIILSFKEKTGPTPEFPLGINLIMLLVPIIPLAYLWRLRRKVTKQ